MKSIRTILKMLIKIYNEKSNLYIEIIIKWLYIYVKNDNKKLLFYQTTLLSAKSKKFL